ncbi:hypothetical protein H6758_03110 [Candidatus Nomurabacteria bacterium]|nr:hypothetical protein [Candidatus Nomurabacteria bacterium]
MQQKIGYVPVDDPDAAMAEIMVWNVPYMRGKITMDNKGYFYIYIHSRLRWFRVGHGIFVLYRMICHMLDTHAREMPTIKQIRKALDGLDVDFQVLEPPQTDRFGQGTYIRGVLSAHLSELARAVDCDKVEARKLIVHMLGVHGLGEGQELKTVVLTCLSEDARESLLDRLSSISSMHPHLCYYRAQVRQMILLLEDLLDQGVAAAQSLIRYLDPSAGQPANILETKINAVGRWVSMMRIKPYSHIPGYAVSELEELRQLARVTGKQEEALALARRIHSGLLIMKMRRSLALSAMHVDHGNKALKTKDVRASSKPMRQSLLRRIIASLESTSRQCAQIDETGFSNPVCDQIRANLLQVLSHLKQILSLLETDGDREEMGSHFSIAAAHLKNTAQLI